MKKIIFIATIIFGSLTIQAQTSLKSYDNGLLTIVGRDSGARIQVPITVTRVSSTS